MAEEERFTICVSDEHRSSDDLKRGVCPDCGEPFIEVVPASLLTAERELRETRERERDLMIERCGSLGSVVLALEADRERLREIASAMYKAINALDRRFGVPNLAPEFPTLYTARTRAAPILDPRASDARSPTSPELADKDSVPRERTDEA